MISHTTEQFRKLFTRLPEPIQRQAREAYSRFLKNPRHPSLHFKRVHSTRPIYSIRISRNYRVVGIRDADEIVWFWTGPHSEYGRLLRQL